MPAIHVSAAAFDLLANHLNPDPAPEVLSKFGRKPWGRGYTYIADLTNDEMKAFHGHLKAAHKVATGRDRQALAQVLAKVRRLH